MDVRGNAQMKKTNDVSAERLADLERRSGIMSPHADTLGIGDLEDIESVASEQST